MKLLKLRQHSLINFQGLIFFTGGPMKIYGFRIKEEFNYKSILAGCRDTALTIVEQALKKFDIATSDPNLYCLVQVKFKFIIFYSAIFYSSSFIRSLRLKLNFFLAFFSFFARLKLLLNLVFQKFVFFLLFFKI